MERDCGANAPARNYAGTDEPKQDTITNKAQRILGLVNQASDRLMRVENSIYPPRPEKLSNAAPSPSEPEHVVFVLEQAEQRLDTLVHRIEELASRL